VLTRPAAVTVSAFVCEALPIASALLLVLVLVSTPPTARLLPPAPPMNGASRTTRPVPLTVRSPLVATVAPFRSNRSPVTFDSPVSAEFVAASAAIATRALAPLSQSEPSTFPI